MRSYSQQNQGETALDFFIKILASKLKISMQQTTALYAENNKYLAHIITKGVQGNYEPVIEYH